MNIIITYLYDSLNNDIYMKHPKKFINLHNACSVGSQEDLPNNTHLVY